MSQDVIEAEELRIRGAERKYVIGVLLAAVGEAITRGDKLVAEALDDAITKIERMPYKD